MHTILVVEDNEDLAFGLSTNLEAEGYEVKIAHDGASGLKLARHYSLDLIILDLTLPKIDGIEVLRQLRDGGHNVPVLVLTARDDEADKVRGLKLGADDYVTKPFGLLELLARVEALLRRHSNSNNLDIGYLEIDWGSRLVKREGSIVELAPREFDLLNTLVRHNGKVVSRRQLLAEAWGHSGEVITRTVDTHVAELRRKLELNPSKPEFIHTVRKAGYRFDYAPNR